MVRFPGGLIELGTDDRAVAYDNERPRHRSRIRPFWIDQAPVTNGQHLSSWKRGGYRRRELWSEAGWAFVTTESLEAPKYWYHEDGEWHTRYMDRKTRVNPDTPVCHVCFHEAEAFARYAGKRLPREAEWEAAAAWDPASGEMRMYPWGNEPVTPAMANVDQFNLRAGPDRGLSHERLADWMLRHDRGRMGVDQFGFRGIPGVSGVSVKRILRGIFWPGVQGAERWIVGDAPRRYSRYVPQLGLSYSPPDLQRLPVARDA